MEITATVDRIEGELAVLLLRGDEKVKFNLPVVFLAGKKRDYKMDNWGKKNIWEYYSASNFCFASMRALICSSETFG